MKHLKISFLVFCIAFFTCNISISQPIHKTLVCTIDAFDYGGEIGVVSGTYTYHFMYKLNKDGFIESIHWNVINCNLSNKYIL